MSKSGILGSTLIAFCVVYLLKDSIDIYYLSLWFGLHCLIMLYRIYITKFYQNTHQEEEELWLTLFTISTKCDTKSVCDK